MEHFHKISLMYAESDLNVTRAVLKWILHNFRYLRIWHQYSAYNNEMFDIIFIDLRENVF